MANRDVDELESNLSKKQRLINAWIAVGPEGKTTDVSELTDSSRGYASDLRRALEGEEEEEIDIDEIQEAFHPELVDKYRSGLGEEAVNGEWEFTEKLGQRPEAEQQPAAPPEPEQQPPETGRRPPQQQPEAAGGPGRPGQQPGGGRQGRQPPTAPRQPRQPPQQPGQQQPYSQPTQQPTPTAQPTQQPGGQAAYTGQPPTQTGQPTPQAGQPMQPQPGQVSPQQTQQQLLGQLRELDNSLTVQQQKAQTELNSVPPQSVAQNVAISKYNLIVEMRQSLQQLMNTLSGQ